MFQPAAFPLTKRLLNLGYKVTLFLTQLQHCDLSGLPPFGCSGALFLCLLLHLTFRARGWRLRRSAPAHTNQTQAP